LRTSARVVAFILLALPAFGCAHYVRNAPVAAVDRQAGYRFQNLGKPGKGDELFLILSFSGGGTRAAALSYGVLKKLAETRIVTADGPTTLLDEVDVISSVSGGSFTAAYYALFGGERLFRDFEPRFLRQNIQGQLVRAVFSPVNWVRLASPNYDRIDMAADLYNRKVFEKRTFADLVRKAERPYIILNATDMSAGHRFEFTQAQFDLLCSDLTNYPVARAVAASSAFPGLLNPLTVDNYANRCGYQPPAWATNAQKDRLVNPRRYVEAGEVLSYLAGDRPYIHLMDGGVSDNIGLRGPERALTSTSSDWSVVNKINNREIRRVAVIVVNARTESENTWDRRENAPNLIQSLQTAAGTPMQHYSFETVERLREHFAAERKDTELVRRLHEKYPDIELPTGGIQQVEFYNIDVSFDEVPDAKEQKALKSMPTTFALPGEAIDRLIRVGPEVLDQSADFRRLLKDLQAPAKD
jgi:NTE family protein